MVWLFAFVAVAIGAHFAPFPFALDVTTHTMWRMPAVSPPSVYLTFDNGPNTLVTPQVLDVLAKHEVSATFFILDERLTAETRPVLTRIFEDGHAVGLHLYERRMVFAGWGVVATTLQEGAARVEVWTGHQTCRAFRSRAGFRSLPMLMAAARAGYTLVGWGHKVSERRWGRRRTPETLAAQLASRASPGQIIVMQDGDGDPRADHRYVVETLDRAIPLLKARGYQFATICP